MQQLELPTTAERPTQKKRVLALLVIAGADGACISNAPHDLAYTFRNRVAELRADGYTIDGARCNAHNHRSGVLRYVLRGRA